MSPGTQTRGGFTRVQDDTEALPGGESIGPKA